jgi:hypothetical protein
MKYGDFSSVVQLGVGLHVGTAILQLYGEFGVEPLARTLARTKSLIEEAAVSTDLNERFEQLVSDYAIFRIRLFQEFKRYIIINSMVALALTAFLIVLAYKADDPITDEWWPITIPIIALSVLPAIITFSSLWIDASHRLRPLKVRGDALEKEALGIR